MVEDTDLSAGVGDADVAAGVTLLCELAGEELVELSAEDTVRNKLALLGHLRGRHLGSTECVVGAAGQDQHSIQSTRRQSSPVCPIDRILRSTSSTWPDQQQGDALRAVS